MGIGSECRKLDTARGAIGWDEGETEVGDVLGLRSAVKAGRS